MQISNAGHLDFELVSSSPLFRATSRLLTPETDVLQIAFTEAAQEIFWAPRIMELLTVVSLQQDETFLGLDPDEAVRLTKWTESKEHS